MRLDECIEMLTCQRPSRADEGKIDGIPSTASLKRTSSLRSFPA